MHLEIQHLKKTDDASIKTVESTIKLGFASGNVTAGDIKFSEITVATASADGTGAAWIKAHLDDNLTLQYYSEVTFTVAENGDITIDKSK